MPAWFNTAPGDLAIVDVSRRQEQDDRTAFRVADRVELGVGSTFRAADTMSQGPPYGWPPLKSSCRYRLRRLGQGRSEAMQVAVLGIDLGKNTCSVVGLDDSGKVRLAHVF